jgi:hypothetical protein
VPVFVPLAIESGKLVLEGRPACKLPQVTMQVGVTQTPVVVLQTFGAHVGRVERVQDSWVTGCCPQVTVLVPVKLQLVRLVLTQFP